MVWVGAVAAGGRCWTGLGGPPPSALPRMRGSSQPLRTLTAGRQLAAAPQWRGQRPAVARRRGRPDAGRPRRTGRRRRVGERVGVAVEAGGCFGAGEGDPFRSAPLPPLGWPPPPAPTRGRRVAAVWLWRRRRLAAARLFWPSEAYRLGRTGWRRRARRREVLPGPAGGCHGAGKGDQSPSASPQPPRAPPAVARRWRRRLPAAARR